MRTSIFGLAIVVAMFWNATGQAQSAHKSTSLTEIAPGSESSSSLLARSEMQIPKPIPIIRPLRFQEIPVSPGARGGEKRSMVPNNLPIGTGGQDGNEPALTLVPQTNIGR